MGNDGVKKQVVGSLPPKDGGIALTEQQSAERQAKVQKEQEDRLKLLSTEIFSAMMKGGMTMNGVPIILKLIQASVQSDATDKKYKDVRDVILETFKRLSATPSEMQQAFELVDLKLANNLASADVSQVLSMEPENKDKPEDVRKDSGKN